MASQLDDTVVATRPLPGLAAPSQVAISPCGKYLTYLQPDSADDLLTRNLYVMDISNPQAPGKPMLLWDPSEGAETEENLSLEDKLRRERSRQMSVGITQYAWAAVSSRVLIPLGGSIFVKEVGTFGDVNAIRPVFEKSAPSLVGDDAVGGAVDATLSPDGKLVGFVRDSELYVVPLEGSSGPGDAAPPVPVRLTFDARRSGKTNGLADYLAQEEMDRYKGFWFSQCSRYIAFEQVDESHITPFRIMHQGSDLVGAMAQEDHRYPFAGTANPKVTLGVVDTAAAQASGDPPKITWLDISLGDGPDRYDNYLARVDWLPDGSLGVQLQNRAQNELVLYRYDIATGARTELARETSDVWVNLNDLCVSFEAKVGEVALGLSHADAMDVSAGSGNADGFFFTWGSERTGFMHLYLYYYHAETGEVRFVRQLTDGDWMVTSLLQVSFERGLLFFSATADSPLTRHVYACRLWGGSTDPAQPEQVTKGRPGTHAMVIDGECSKVVCTSSSVAQAPTTFLAGMRFAPGTGAISLEPFAELHAGAESPLLKAHLDKLRPSMRTTELISFNADDGTRLYGALYRPDAAKHGPGPYPLVVAVYGGPHVQRVTDAWSTTADMRAQRFADLGYVVFKVDNRGSSGRGIAFEGAIKHRMGTVEIDDQVAGVQHLVKMGLADAGRVGIYGWSYGGYMSLMCLCKRPDVFHVAVSGAPVTHWDGYDTHYTERYMGTPASNPAGYENAAVMKHVNNLQGKLMLVHGLIDENVHFRHTSRLINSIIAARKNYDLLLFPDERHSPRKLQDRIYMEQRIREYFEEHLRSASSKKPKVGP